MTIIEFENFIRDKVKEFKKSKKDIEKENNEDYDLVYGCDYKLILNEFLDFLNFKYILEQKSTEARIKKERNIK